MSDATLDPTVDPTLAPSDDSEAAQQPEDPTTSEATSPASPDGLAEIEPTEENTAPDAPAPEFQPEIAGADDSKTEGAPEADPTAMPEAISDEGDAPAAKTMDHTEDFGTSSDKADGAADAHVDTPTSDMSDVAQHNELDPNANDEAAKQDDAEAKEGVAGDGPTHGGTDTPKTLVQNPADPVTGKPIDGSGQPEGVVMGGSGSLNRPHKDLEGAFGTCGGDDSSLPNGAGDDSDSDDGDDYTGESADDDSDEGSSDASELVEFIEEAFDSLLQDIKARI